MRDDKCERGSNSMGGWEMNSKSAVISKYWFVSSLNFFGYGEDMFHGLYLEFRRLDHQVVHLENQQFPSIEGLICLALNCVFQRRGGAWIKVRLLRIL